MQKGDKLQLDYTFENEVKFETVTVNPDGAIEPKGLPSAKGKPVLVAGKTVDEVAKELAESVNKPAVADAKADQPAVKVSVLNEDDNRAGSGGTLGAARGKAFGAPPATRPSTQESLKDVAARRATGAPLAVAATQPAAGEVADSDIVDVVIVIQNNTAPALSAIVDPAAAARQLKSAPTAPPTTSPTTSPAATEPVK